MICTCSIQLGASWTIRCNIQIVDSTSDPSKVILFHILIQGQHMSLTTSCFKMSIIVLILRSNKIVFSIEIQFNLKGGMMFATGHDEVTPKMK